MFFSLEDYEWIIRGVLDLTFDPNNQRLFASAGDSSVACWVKIQWDQFDKINCCCFQNLNQSIDQSSVQSNERNCETLSSTDNPTSTPISTNHVNLPNYIIPGQYVSQSDQRCPNRAIIYLYYHAGFARIRQFKVLRDQRTIVAQSLLLDVETYDIIEVSVLKAFQFLYLKAFWYDSSILKDSSMSILGRTLEVVWESWSRRHCEELTLIRSKTWTSVFVAFFQVVKESPFISVLPWCSVDIVLGVCVF